MTQSTNPFEAVTGFVRTLDQFTKGNVSAEKLFSMPEPGPKYIRADEIAPGTRLVVRNNVAVVVTGVVMIGEDKREFRLGDHETLTVLNNMKVQIDG